MKSSLLTLLAGLAACLYSAAGAKEKELATGKPIFPSPNGMYAVRFEPDEERMITVNLIAVKSGNVLLQLDSLGHPWINESTAVWSPDSKRLAWMSGSRRGGWTTLYVQKADMFEQVPMPELIYARIKGTSEHAKTILAARVPIRWTKPNVLLLENDVEDDEGGSATSRMYLTFDAKNRVTVTRAK